MHGSFVGHSCPSCSTAATVPGLNKAAPVAAIRTRILGEPIAQVQDAEELLWRVAAFLEREETTYARRNFAARIRKALAGGDWREELTDEEVDRYGF